jgi:DNA-binding response OmpR family regulator
MKFEASLAIRSLSDPARSRVPIIALTASTLQEDIDRCLAAGMNAHVSKPIDSASLAACVRQWATPLDVAAACSTPGSRHRSVSVRRRTSTDAQSDGAFVFEPAHDVSLAARSSLSLSVECDSVGASLQPVTIPHATTLIGDSELSSRLQSRTWASH